MDRSEDSNLDVPEQEPIGIFEGPIGAGGVPVPEEVLEKLRALHDADQRPTNGAS
jgi:hypothetical protein